MNNKYQELQKLLIKEAGIEKLEDLSPEVLERKKQELTIMNDTLAKKIFYNDNNKHLLAGIANAIRKIYNLPDVSEISKVTVQKISITKEFFEKDMISDVVGTAEKNKGDHINIAMEIQNRKQDGYSSRSVLSSSNATRDDFLTGENYTNAPDVMSINVLGFNLPELSYKNSFCTRIVRADYDTGEHFLADKYSDFFLELRKTPVTIDKLPGKYHDLWEICKAINCKAKDYDKVVSELSNATAVGFIDASKEVLSNKQSVKDILDVENIRELLNKKEEMGIEKGIEKGKEEMFRMAIKCNASNEVLQTMARESGISPQRANELIKEINPEKSITSF